ncbi:hypothetical protein V9T40_012592 [Parthenolecanium corni]|uniref:Secreted protein n=1 Tax=Parthenolecanium corni TaxID=536013 RepID=A0AAN9TNF3_9HEMI
MHTNTHGKHSCLSLLLLVVPRPCSLSSQRCGWRLQYSLSLCALLLYTTPTSRPKRATEATYFRLVDMNTTTIRYVRMQPAHTAHTAWSTENAAHTTTTDTRRSVGGVGQKKRASHKRRRRRRCRQQQGGEVELKKKYKERRNSKGENRQSAALTK